ncbi:MAG: GNAT family N-acetyltransferase, partial [Candidatus Heimdallarchaeota archaeon]|nr:GNAT family N-acetyltransferase [Candidatus Heimdallarchaeota archaeon]
EDREAFAKLGRYAFDAVKNTYEDAVPEDYEKTHPHLKDMSEVYGSFDGEDLVASSAFFSTLISIRQKELPMAGIWGVATKPTHRKKGLIKEILSYILKEMYSSDILISTLYPFKFSFYEKFGWKLANENHRYHLEIDNFITRPVNRTVREVTQLDQIKEVYSKIVSSCKYNYITKRTDKEWRMKINPKKPGYLFVCYDENEKPCGYLIERFLEHEPLRSEGLDKAGETIYLSEIFWYDRETRQALFNFLKTHVDHRKYIVFSSAEPNLLASLKEARIKANEVFTGSMARIVNLKAIIESFDYPMDTEFILHVKDEICDWNNGNFTIKISNGHAFLERSDKDPEVTIDIGSLTQMVVGFTNASQLHESWDIDCSKELLSTLDRLFPLENNFFRDFF